MKYNPDGSVVFVGRFVSIVDAEPENIADTLMSKQIIVTDIPYVLCFVEIIRLTIKL